MNPLDEPYTRDINFFNSGDIFHRSHPEQKRYDTSRNSRPFIKYALRRNLIRFGFYTAKL